MQMQFGHPDGEDCPFPRSQQNFVVAHLNGIHTIVLSFCGCNDAPEPFSQLLEARWWPSTPRDPKTAFTFSLMRTFHLLNLQGRLAPTDFYRSLQKIENGDGLVKSLVSYV